jgi:hypothetical protein
MLSWAPRKLKAAQKVNAAQNVSGDRLPGLICIVSVMDP